MKQSRPTKVSATRLSAIQVSLTQVSAIQIPKVVKALAFANIILASSVCARACLADTALNPKAVLEFPISQEGLTRISIENDGIEDIYAYPTEYADNISHHKSGHVFVVADDLESPFYVTLITKRGAAQDLKLIPRAKKAEPILLRFEDANPGSSEAPPTSPQDVYAGILGQFVSQYGVHGIAPSGFFPTTVDEVGRSAGPAEAVLEKAYQNGRHRVLVFGIRNEGADKVTLDNRVFWGKGDLASAFDQPALKLQESAKLYVIQHH